uniref:Uncharacterized protein n=1 Tax=Solanum lycopersicum TaxID=4081 RepID=A0A3Q7IMB4_SOLLC
MIKVKYQDFIEIMKFPIESLGNISIKDSEIYEIDYRGPETHTYIPPPKGSKGKHNFHHQNMMLKHHRKFKGLKVPEKFSGEKIHG